MLGTEANDRKNKVGGSVFVLVYRGCSSQFWEGPKQWFFFGGFGCAFFKGAFDNANPFFFPFFGSCRGQSSFSFRKILRPLLSLLQVGI